MRWSLPRRSSEPLGLPATARRWARLRLQQLATGHRPCSPLEFSPPPGAPVRIPAGSIERKGEGKCAPVGIPARSIERKGKGKRKRRGKGKGDGKAAGWHGLKELDRP